MKCTRQRCHVAPTTRWTAAFSPSCASEITSLTPRRPRLVRRFRKSAHKVSASDGPVPSPTISRRPSVLAATAIIAATETMRPPSRTFRWTREGWLYLAVVIDLFARRVVGWAAGDRLHKELALLALRRAVAVRCPSAGLIHHADRGSQYCSVEYQAELRKNGISISMSGKGNCFDNAMVETFFKTLKAELVWRTMFQSRIEAAIAIGRYIDGFYNPVRRHSALDFISPLQFEGRAA